MEARIIRVANAYDAMTTSRPYRRGISLEAAMNVPIKFAGRQFDPEIVAATRDVEEAFRRQEAVDTEIAISRLSA